MHGMEVSSEEGLVLMTHDELLVLHKPMLWKNLGNDTEGYKCQVCEGNSYPCPTIQAIEKEQSSG